MEEWENLPLEFRGRVDLCCWWPLGFTEAMAENGVHSGPKAVLAKNWLRWAHLWFGTEGLPSWPLLASLELGQKGPKWPVGHGLRPTGHRGRKGPKWPKPH
ncbi:hypothetical protein O181_049719 [Austropuccinia psidii MF-1]|uniref:Uncharacterized protein n=1 Tax=Austropuccinia psidii MF-1 TaxID=1389203 RepID=A0A9Q3DVD0_9BASI|nr:hypothetical protein [Austropuccinia psidii MF-1]